MRVPNVEQLDKIFLINWDEENVEIDKAINRHSDKGKQFAMLMYRIDKLINECLHVRSAYIGDICIKDVDKILKEYGCRRESNNPNDSAYKYIVCR
jgi:hypothetical protein